MLQNFWPFRISTSLFLAKGMPGMGGGGMPNIMQILMSDPGELGGE